MQLTKAALKKYKNEYAESLFKDLTEWVGPNWDDFFYVIICLFILAALIVVIDFIINNILLRFTKGIVNATKFNWDNSFYKHKVFNSIYHLIPVSLAQSLAPYLFYKLPLILEYVYKALDILLVLVFVQMFLRIINSISDIATDENNYRTVAIRTFGQLMKVVLIFLATLVVISILFNVKWGTIVTGLGATMAILLLIFRDTILGFVSGVQIAATRMVKVGDWVGIPKYNLEGTVIEINLVSAKIREFDKTVSSIPTYDFITTQIKNYESMRTTHTRRIKRSIVFNVKSFAFLSKEELDKFKNVDLLKEYITNKEKEIYSNQTIPYESKKGLNGRRLTNIGLFREYAYQYLLNDPKVSHKEGDALMVRQLDITPQGMPMEIYCFANTTVWEEYEEIQSDIFDHLVTSSKEFGLEVSQVLSI